MKWQRGKWWALEFSMCEERAWCKDDDGMEMKLNTERGCMHSTE